jgi:hypothetical protein
MIGPCGVEHLNNFVHLDVDFGGIEKRFHLAEKFDSTGDYLPAWFVSVRSDSIEMVKELTRQNGGSPITLHYGLPRELLMLVDSEVNTARSNERLKNMALIYLREDLLRLRRGKRPTNLARARPTWVDEAQAGRLWVVQTLQLAASEMGIEVKTVEWVSGPVRVEPSRLRVSLDNGNFEEAFSYEDLCECPGTPEIRRELTLRVQTALERYRPKPKKIGF